MAESYSAMEELTVLTAAVRTQMAQLQLGTAGPCPETINNQGGGVSPPHQTLSMSLRYLRRDVYVSEPDEMIVVIPRRLAVQAQNLLEHFASEVLGEGRLDAV